MKLNDNARELLDRYLYAVKRELTGQQREDISKELESYILDLLEERCPAGEEVSKEQLGKILEEMGSPRKVAAQYMPQRYLIGPQLFPIFFLVLKVVVLVVIGALTLSFIVSGIAGELTHVGMSLLDYFGSVFSGALSAAGAVTLTFAIIERVSETKPLDELKELQEFKLSELPELPADERKFSRAGTIFELVLGSIGLAFFIYIYANGGQLPFFNNPGGKMQMVQLFSDGFLKIVPLIIALTGLDIVRNSLLIMNGYHSPLTSWWKICTEAVNIVVLVLLLGARPLITLASPIIAAAVPDVDFVQIESLVNMSLTIALSIGLFGLIVGTIKMIVAEVRNPTM